MAKPKQILVKSGLYFRRLILVRQWMMLIAMLSLVSIGPLHGTPRCQDLYGQVMNQLRQLVFSGNIPRVGVGPATIPILNLRFAQAQLLQFLLAYQPVINQKILEIGYGHPALLKSLQIASHDTASLTGVDVIPIPDTWRMPELANISLRTETAPFTGVPRSVSAQERFNIIIGVDIFKAPHHFKFGKPFKLDIDPGQYLLWINQHLEPGGSFWVLNDFAAPPLFSRAQFEQANLHVQIWGADPTKQMPEFNRDLMLSFQKDINGPLAGHLRLYVIKKK